MQLILGSSSPYRQERLSTLGIPFITASPDIDESPLEGEEPEALVKRLSLEKARAIAQQHSPALIIGSDQIALCERQILGKPGSETKAIQQLNFLNGKIVTFLTGLCLLNTETQQAQLCVEPFKVHFRSLSQHEIEHYVKREQPLNCAGSFKSEGLGITLFKRLDGDDPNALIGLPLIKLTDFLMNEGMSPLLSF